MVNPILEYYTLRGNSMTFEDEKVLRWVQNHLDPDDKVLNPCCGETDLNHSGEVVRNDIKYFVDADLHVDVRDIENHLEKESFDVITYDPPFSEDQSEKTYGTGELTLYDKDTLDGLRSLLKPGGILITFAYSAQLTPGMIPENITLWNIVGRGKDYIATIQRKPLTADSPKQCDYTDHVFSSSQVDYNPPILGVKGGSTQWGNEGRPIEMEIKTLQGKSDNELQKTLREEIITEAIGDTIVITDRDRGFYQYQNVVVVSTKDNVFGNYYIDIRNLSDHFPKNRFNTAIIDLDPTKTYNWKTYTPEIKKYGKTGYVKTIKEQLRGITDSSNSRIIQAGFSATNMRGGIGYIRKKVKIVTDCDAISNPIISIDEPSNTELPSAQDKETDGELDRAELSHPMAWYEGDINPESFRYINKNTKEGSYHHPAYGIDCPNCGSIAGNYCVDNSNKVIHHPHRSRIEDALNDKKTKPITDEFGPTGFQRTDPARPVSRGGKKVEVPEDPNKQDSADNQKLTAFL